MKEGCNEKSSPNCSSKNSLESEFKSSPKLLSKIKKIIWNDNIDRYNGIVIIKDVINDNWEVVYE
jgi:hypothetical protein